MFSYRARRTIFCKKSLFTTVKLISFSFCPVDKVPVGFLCLERFTYNEFQSVGLLEGPWNGDCQPQPWLESESLCRRASRSS